MVYGLGPRAQRVHAALHERIARGEWPPGTKLPPHLDLAAEFGVAPMTVRQVLSHLEEEGLVSRQQGRGTFVREAATLAVLIVVAEPALGVMLADQIAHAGFRGVATHGPADGLAVLANDPSIALVLAGLRLPGVPEGTGFVRAVRRRRPELPVAVLVADLGDLGDLYGTQDWPLLVVPTPIRLSYIEEVLRLTLGTRKPNGGALSSGVIGQAPPAR